MENTDNDSNTRDDCSRSHALTGSRAIGPSSTDFDGWLSSDPVGQSIRERIKSDTLTEAAAYQIWRDAWMACEIEHGFRKTLNGREAKFLSENTKVEQCQPTDNE